MASALLSSSCGGLESREGAGTLRHPQKALTNKAQEREGRKTGVCAALGEWSPLRYAALKCFV